MKTTKYTEPKTARGAYDERIQMVRDRLDTLTTYYSNAATRPNVTWANVSDVGHTMLVLGELMRQMGLLPDADATENARVAAIVKNGGYR